MGKNNAIYGVNLIPLNQIPDEKGKVMHMLRNCPQYLSSIREVYFSLTYPKKVKAWKQHKKMTQRLTVPVGQMKIVLYDDRKDSPTYQFLSEIILGEDNYQLLILPPLIWYGFECISEQSGLIVNCSDLEHDPDEVNRLPIEQNLIPYQWT